MASCLCSTPAHVIRPFHIGRFLSTAVQCAEAGPSTPARHRAALPRRPTTTNLRPPIQARAASHYSPFRPPLLDHPPTYRARASRPSLAALAHHASTDPHIPFEKHDHRAHAWWDPFKRAAAGAGAKKGVGAGAGDPMDHIGEATGKGAYEMSDQEEEAAKAAILENVMMGKQPADLHLRCTVLDADGDIKTISGKFKKTDLCIEHRLNPRDLRKIDSRVPNVVPTILCRKDCILVNILHIRALVKSDTVLLFDTYGSVDTRLNSVFLYHLEHNLKFKSSSLPYEFRALESILSSVVSALESEMVLTRHLTTSLLSELEDDIDRDKLKRLLHYSRRLAGFRNRSKLVDVALEEVLEQDEDLAAMYLTDKKSGRPRALADHEDLEILLETFAKQVEEIENEASTMMGNVQSTQEIVELILDSNRNSLLALDIKVAIITLGAGIGSVGAGLFGMNLRSHMEDSPHAFLLVSGAAVVVAALVSFVGLSKLARLRRIGLASGRAGKKRLAFDRGWMLPAPLRGWKGTSGKDIQGQ